MTPDAAADATSPSVASGVWRGVGAYGIWGLFPIYWKLIEHVPASQVIAHRLAWSFLVLAVTVAVVSSRRRLSSPSVLLSRRLLGIYTVAAVLISANWFTYIWAVEHGFVVETSLGYFMTPLVNVVLGVLAFRERLRVAQWVAVVMATAGVVYLTIAYGTVPVIALVLALTFGSYGMVKKQAPLAPLVGLMLETGLLFVPAVAFLVFVEWRGTGAFLHTGMSSDLLMAGAGLVTTVPLLLFASAVQRIPLTIVGVLQYISPTIQFLLGVLLYREPFSSTQLVGFSMVWAALVVFSVDGVRRRAPGPVPRRREAVVAAPDM